MILFYFYSLMVIVQSIQIQSIDLSIKFHFECLPLVRVSCKLFCLNLFI